jgi:hypothetical protein
METATSYRNSTEIEEVVRKLETCEYDNHEFYHSRHLAVAAWYLTFFPPELALEKMRASLLRFTQHHGRKAYHETITRFWLLMVQQFLQTAPGSLPQQVNELIHRYNDKNLLFEFYDRERVMSEEARQSWVEPNRNHLRNLFP